MLNKNDLATIELCLIAQINEIKKKLEFYKLCRNIEWQKQALRSIKYFDEIRQKVKALGKATEQLKL